MMDKPTPTLGMRHIALTVKALEACTAFYTRLLGMTIDWQPDADNVYLTSGHDNLALHRAPIDFDPSTHQRLDHIGFFLDKNTDVDTWCDWLTNHDIKILAQPRNHRDGTRSFYCADPDGNTVQLIHMPNFTEK